METSLETGFKINGQDLSNFIELSRDPATDPPSPFAERGYTNTGKRFDLTKAVAAEEFSYETFDINPYLKTEKSTGSFPLLMGKGCRPRLDLKVLNFYKSFSGTSQVQYYYLARTETSLYIFSSYNPHTGYSVAFKQDLGSPTSIKVITGDNEYGAPRNLVSSGIPKLINVELVGGGGGGAGGTWGFGWGNSYGGSGGAGGGIAYARFPIGPYRSNFSSRDSSTDYYFSVHKGGSGGSWAGILSSGDTAGKDGTNTVCFGPDGTVIAIGVRGKGGNAYRETTVGYPQPSYGMYEFHSRSGGRWGTPGEPAFASDTDIVYRERIKTLFLGSIGGWTFGSGDDRNGGGGGASKGNGGYGRGWKLQGPQAGNMGSGGGGGSGGVGEACNGASGGTGVLSFFY